MGVFDGKEAIKHALFACVMGVVASCASIVLCLVVGLAYSTVLECQWLLFLLPVLGVLTTLLYKWWRLPLNTTTRSVVSAIRTNEQISPFLAPGILIGTFLSILGGASVGKEAGALHMGASLGDLISRPFKLKPVSRKDQAAAQQKRERIAQQASSSDQKAASDGSEAAASESFSSRLFRKDTTPDGGMRAYAASLGMAATFSALFFAPIGSAFFVFELTRYKRSVIKHAFSILVACFIAYFIASAIGIGDIIPKVHIPDLSWPVVGQCLVVGVTAGVAGSLFVKGIEGLQAATQRISKNYYLWVFIGGIIICAIVLMFGWQAYEGTGSNQLALALKGEQDVWGFAIKAVLTMFALGLWFKGGEIMPTFTVGALLGASCTVMTGGDVGIAAAVGLVAFFTAMSRCPLAAFLMGCEIFGWTAAPLFAIAAVVAFSLGKDVGYYGEGATETVRLMFGGVARKSNEALYEAAANPAESIHEHLTSAEKALESLENPGSQNPSEK